MQHKTFGGAGTRRSGGFTRIARLIAFGTVAALAATAVDPSIVDAHAAPAERTPAERTATDNGAALAYYQFTDYDRDNTVQNSVPDGAAAALLNGATITNDSAWPTTNTGNSLHLDGVDDQLTSPVVVPTDGSFTVSAWAKLDRTDRQSVVFSQDGSRVSGFSLRANADGHWAFAVAKSDADGAATDSATGPAAVAGTWTQLAGVFDAGARQLRLYVNGMKVATAPHTATWAATGGLRAGRGMAAGAPTGFLAGNVDELHAWRGVLAEETLGELAVQPDTARSDRCAVGHWLHAGGPAVKAAASTALAGTDYDRRAVYQNIGWFPNQLEGARSQDDDTYLADYRAQGDRYTAWGAVLTGYEMWGSDDFITFHTVPEYGEAMHRFLMERNDETFHSYFTPPAPPKPAPAELDKALAIAADMRAGGDMWAPEDWMVRSWSANRIERFLRFGGSPTVTPVPGSLEFRTEVESVKIAWAGCDTGDPDGVVKAGSWTGEPGPMAEVTTTAKREWNAELAAQAPQRGAIVNAEITTMQNVRTASAAMIEAQGQAWVAGQLLKWKKLWLGRPKTYPSYPTPAQFTKANQDLTTAKDRVAAQLTIAQGAAAAARTQVNQVNTAQQQAADIAVANGTPMYRGLAYAQQSAQVAKASAAAAQAASDAIQTTLNAVRAANADGNALESLAQTQQLALETEFRRAAAQEAAAQAKAAAQAAAAQAAQAAQNAARAKADRATAEGAERRAKTAADAAHQKRQVAEAERANAAAARAKAESERTKAQQAEARAADDEAAAVTALGNANAAGQTAHQKRLDAEEAERRASQARDQAIVAERQRDALAARAAAAEALAAATDASKDGGAARRAANDARSAANDAGTAATAARTEANVATQAAAEADAAATRAEAAASRSRAAAKGAQADADTAYSEAATAHYAAADAINAAQAAAGNVRAAEVDAQNAQAAAATAKADATAARDLATQALAESARTAGQAYAAGQAALAARDSAAATAASATDAIALGSPYRDTDASAGMAVLVGQSAKTLAEQQAAAAQVRADEAARAARAAAQAAAQAAADAKLAAEAAASAAADTVRAMDSVKQARASAAAAAVDAAAAQTAAAHAEQSHQQAQGDAYAADAAANAAESDATAARNAATDAERDAAAARAAATRAEQDASTARDVAAQADRDATAAETAATHAQQDAQQAQDAASHAEAEANARVEAAARGEAGPAGEDGLQVIADVKDDIPKHLNCVQNTPTTCVLTVPHHLTGQLIYQLVSCPDPNTTYCPGDETIDYLGSFPVNLTINKTMTVSLIEITEAFWKALAYGMVSDFIGCARGKLGDCAWAAATLLAPAVLKVAARSVVALRIAMRSGAGLAEALEAMRAASIDVAAMARLRVAVNDLLRSCGLVPHSFDGRTEVVMADGSRKPISAVRIGDRVRTTDPATGRTVVGTVTHRYTNHDRDLTDLSVRDGRGRVAVVHTAGHHPFWDETRRRWIGAADLTVGDRLHSLAGGTVTVAGVRSFAGRAVMYDLTVDDAHTYYVVAGQTPVLVHNCNGLGDLWQVWERVMGANDGHVMIMHGYGTPAVSVEGTISKFGQNVTGEMVVNETIKGVSDATFRGAGRIPGTHYHIYNTGKPGFGTVDGVATSWIKIYVEDGTGNLGTVFPVLPPS